MPKALEAFGFVQADPIRAPARAQDLTLRHRVTNYRAGDLERRYSRLHVHEDVFINYGFVTDRVFHLMHPRRRGQAPWSVAGGRHVKSLLEFIRARGPVHPRQVDDQFSLGTVTNYWGGSSSATTQLLDAMHYRGLLRVVRREAGVRIYGLHEQASEKGRPQGRPLPTRSVDARDRRIRLDALVDVVVNLYAPLPATRLRPLLYRLRYGVPRLVDDLDGALARVKQRLAHARIDGVDWCWPEAEQPKGLRQELTDQVRLLAPFDPIVWDRKRFELLWGWPYRFEAYAPASQRKFGYYALPLLWHDKVIGWANLSVNAGALVSVFGYAHRAPQGREFRHELETELERMRAFLNVPGDSPDIF